MIAIKKKYFYLLVFFLSFVFSHFGFSQNGGSLPTIYEFQVTDINGDTFDFRRLLGHKMLIVNTASKCGFTPQYEALQALYEQYRDKKIYRHRVSI